MILVLFLHWLADFVFQTNWMATNKSKSRAALGAHVGVYSLVMLLGLILTCPFTGWGIIPIAGIVLLNAIGHYVTDGITSKISGHFAKKMSNGDLEARRKFWWMIGFDQFIHAATLIGLTKMLVIG